MLSNTCKYAIRALIYIAVHAREGEKIGIRKIAEDLEIPMPFLGKILQQLARNKILSSTKGPHGGFGIGKDPSKISLYEVVNVIDSADAFDLCVIGLKNCNEQEIHCSLHEAYSPVREATRQIFRSTTIGDLAEGIREGRRSIII